MLFMAVLIWSFGGSPLPCQIIRYSFSHWYWLRFRNGIFLMPFWVCFSLVSSAVEISFLYSIVPHKWLGVLVCFRISFLSNVMEQPFGARICQWYMDSSPSRKHFAQAFVPLSLLYARIAATSFLSCQFSGSPSGR